MVSAGDLVRSADGYRLSDRLLARQRRQDDAIDPSCGHGTDPGRPWLSPASVPIPAPAPRCEPRCTTSASVSCARECGCARTTSNSTWTRSSRPGCGYCRPATTTRRAHRQLWDLPSWARTGHRLLDEMSRGHRCSRPIRGRRCNCPPSADRPGAARRIAARRLAGRHLRAAYDDFAAELTERRDDIRLVEAI